jgi:hypothetical protein
MNDLEEFSEVVGVDLPHVTVWLEYSPCDDGTLITFPCGLRDILASNSFIASAQLWEASNGTVKDFLETAKGLARVLWTRYHRIVCERCQQFPEYARIEFK